MGDSRMAPRQHNIKAAQHLGIVSAHDGSACSVKPASDPRIINLVRLLARQAARDFADREDMRLEKDSDTD